MALDSIDANVSDLAMLCFAHLRARRLDIITDINQKKPGEMTPPACLITLFVPTEKQRHLLNQLYQFHHS